MKYSVKFLVVFLAALGSASAQCNPSDLQCCLAEFVSIITPSGIHLSEQRAAAVCTLKDETLDCLDLFADQCLRNETDRTEMETIVNKTRAYIMDICPPTSDFMMKLKESESCILNASSKFQACYTTAVSPLQIEHDLEILKRDCCQYKELRNCAVKTVGDNCGAAASHLIHEEVLYMNGAVLEWACKSIFDDCPNSAVTLASSVLSVLCSYVILRFLS